MIYEVCQPCHPLSPFIDHFWMHEGYSPDHQMERLLPDGTMEIVIDLRSSPKKLFSREDQSSFQTLQRSWISGKQSRYIVIDSSGDSSMIGVHFKPGGAYPFLRFPICTLTDQVVQLDQIWGRAIDSLREQIQEASSILQKFSILEQFLLARFDGATKAVSRMAHILTQILRSPHGMAIRDLASMIGITQKHMISQFDKYVGLKPKAFERICRFQHTLEALENDRPVNWSAVAAGQGYFDQAHFIKDFQFFSGLKPSTYMVEKSAYLNYVPIVG